ncbi:BQ2448_5629 [Microbotryum intermedium]|uniref:BQ2448_5629 protein n=1 Tax=Microbotryum intermedium TaxID=269621 RepID=A0A238F542_9BASI|nr:BQ2448_5629 [Microbotryum intermedium]
MHLERCSTGFHSIMKNSLAQAKGEGLLDDQELSSGDVDIRIAGPGLALFFCALGATPGPSISAPDGSFTLTNDNCPSSFRSFFHLWQTSVTPIRRLPMEARHDLALLLCYKDPIQSVLRRDVVKLAADLKAIGLEIAQRETFQQRFQADLQFALDARVRSYPNDVKNPSGASQSTSEEESSPPQYEFMAPNQFTSMHEGSDTVRRSPEPNLRDPSTVGPSLLGMTPETSDASMMENLKVIRETLYSALADCLVSSSSLRSLASRGPEWQSRLFFASSCFAILEVALTRVDEHGVRTVNLGSGRKTVIAAKDTPPHLQPLFAKLLEISQTARSMIQEDDAQAIHEATEDLPPSTPRLDRLQYRLQNGVGSDPITREGTREEDSDVDDEASAGPTIVMLANAINELALAMARLPEFSERQAGVFKILSAVQSF